MSKSPYVIAGLGLGACVVLSLMMQHLLEVRQERDRPSVVLEVEQILGRRLAGPAALSEQKGEDGKARTLVLHLEVLSGLDKEKVARDAGHLVWLRRDGEHGLEKVLVVVRDEDGVKEEFDIGRPFHSRRPPLGPVHRSAPTPSKPPEQNPPDPTPPKTPR